MTITLSKKEKVMGGLLLALILLLCVREGCNQRDKDGLVADIAGYKDSAKYYSMKVNGLEVDVAYNKSLVLENDKQVKSVLSNMNDTIAKLVKKFKDIRSGTIINNYTTINNDTIRLKGDSIPCDFKPFKVRRDSIHYRFLGTIGRNFFVIDSLVIPNKTTLIVGRKKVGFLKYEDRAELINSNPLVRTTNIGNYEVIKRKKRVGLGFSVGYGFQLNGNGLKLAPTISASVNYNLIEF